MFNNYTYLYVEDDPLSREIMQVAMEEVMGVHQLTLFEDSRNFIARLQALPAIPDLIMLDIHVKPHSGIDMLHMIRENAAYSQTRIVALTASVMNEEVKRMKASGFDGAIAKPIDIGTFAQLIERILSGESVWHIA